MKIRTQVGARAGRYVQGGPDILALDVKPSASSLFSSNAADATAGTRAVTSSIPTRPNEQHGRRLTAAFEALEGFPALAESQTRLLAALAAEPVDPAAVVAALET